MNINKNGIPVVVKNKETRIEDLKLKQVSIHKRVKGQSVTIVIPDFEHVHDVMIADGWRVKEI